MNTRTTVHRICRRNGRTARAGFTLIEVTVTVAILFILLGFLFIPTYTVFNLFRESQGKGEVQADTRLAMEQMSREVQEAVTLAVDTVSVDYDNRDGTNTPEVYERLRFRLPAKRYNSALGMYEIDTPLRPSGPWIVYYVRPAKPDSAGNYTGVYDPADNPMVLYRATVTNPPGPLPDLSSVACCGHTALTGLEDDDVERLSFQLQPTGATTGSKIRSVSIGLQIRRAEYVDKIADPSRSTEALAPRSQLKNVVLTPNAVAP